MMKSITTGGCLMFSPYMNSYIIQPSIIIIVINFYFNIDLYSLATKKHSYDAMEAVL